MPSHSQHTPRHVGLKKASADAQRRTMNERRHELTQKIRKTKRSHLVERKRRFTSSSPETVQDIDPSSLAMAFIKSKDAASLSALASALAKSKTSLALNDKDALPSEDTPAMQLANTLSYVLTESPIDETKLLAARVLTNLAATENASSRENNMDQDNYYQWQAEGWCDVIVRSRALGGLVQTMESSATVVVVEQCCWAIGNVCGDSQKARNAAREAILPLYHAIQKALEWKHVGTCRNAAWALSNLARGTGSGLEFVSQPTATALLVQLLMTPEQNGETWLDVAHEACWIMAFLTAKEDAAIDRLLVCENLSFSAQQTSAVCEALASRLETATRKVRLSHSVSDLMQSLRMSVPCLRAVGNIATGCDGQHVPMLLTVRGGSVAKSLATLVELGSFASSIERGELASVAVEAAWAAGSLLCDAGLPGHQSSTVAIPALLSVLSKTTTSEYAKPDLKREAVSALWNAVAAPPVKDMAQQLSSRELRNGFLVKMANIPGLVAALVALLTSKDMDAVLASVQLLNTLLRHVESIRQMFLEAEGVDALEHVCDAASQMGVGASTWEDTGVSSECAEIAADLIDDLFTEEQEEMDMAPVTSPNGGTYTFGLLTESAQMFDFGKDGQPVNNNTVNMPPQGRGRGKPIPAWMEQNPAQDARKQVGSYPW